jgi:hypothetical protein
MTDLVPTIEVKQPNRGSRITATVLRADLLIGHAPPLMQRQTVADHLQGDNRADLNHQKPTLQNKCHYLLENQWVSLLSPTISTRS